LIKQRLGIQDGAENVVDIRAEAYEKYNHIKEVMK
jgi:hypothetical protein